MVARAEPDSGPRRGESRSRGCTGTAGNSEKSVVAPDGGEEGRSYYQIASFFHR